MGRNPPTRKYRKKKSSRDPVLPPASPTGRGTLRIRQVRSGIGRAPAQRRTLEALGLRHHQHEVIKKDHPALRGMLYKVRHLVRVTAARDGEDR